VLRRVKTSSGWLRYYLQNERYLERRTDVRSWVWLSISLLLNSLSLLSIAEQYMPSGSPLALIVDAYQSLFGALTKRDPLFPQPVPEAFVIMGGVFAAANYFALKADGTNITNRLLFLNSRKPFVVKWWSVFSRLIILYVSGPFAFIFLAVKNLQHGRRFARYLGISFEPLRVVLYYLLLISGNATLLIFIYRIGA
jgi:hypothetical protein